MTVFALALALTLSAPAMQDPVEDQKDARCAVALQGASDEVSDPDQRGAFQAIMLFYFGRLSARNDASGVRAAIDAARAEPRLATYRDRALECVDRMEALTGAK